MRVVKAFAQEDAESRALRRAQRAGLRARARLARASRRATARCSTSCRSSPSRVIILVGGLLVIDGHLSLGGFITYNLYLAILIWPLRMIGMWIGQYQRAVASGERIFQVLDEHSEITDPPAPRRAAGRRRRAALRGRDVRLRRRPPGAARPRSRRCAPGTTIAADRPHGLGQDHARRRSCPATTTRRQAASCSTASTCATSRLADLRGAIATVARGHLPVLDHRRRQHRLRRPGRHARGDRRGGPQGAGARVHRGAAQRLRHARRRARPDALGRPAAAARRSRAPCWSTRAS